MLVKKLGSGAYGKTYLCRHQDGSAFAAKQLPINARNRAELGGWINELLNLHTRWRYAGDHPLLVGWRSYFGHGRYIYLEMDLCGGSLQDLLHRGIGGPAWFVRAAGPLLCGLDVVHGENAVHGDVHAGNVLYVGDPTQGPESVRFKVGDFGEQRNLGRAGGREARRQIAKELADAARVLLQVWHNTPDAIDILSLDARLAVVPDPPRSGLARALDERFLGDLTAATDFLYALRLAEVQP